MTLRTRSCFIVTLVLCSAFLFISCSTFGKKDDKTAKVPEGKTVTVDGMETVKGIHPARPETPPSPGKPSGPPPSPPRGPERSDQVASLPPLSLSTPPLSFFTPGFRKKVVVLDFENKTSYQEEKIGEVVARRFSDRLEASQRAVVIDPVVVKEQLSQRHVKADSLAAPSVIKQAYLKLGVQALVLGTVTDVSLLSAKSPDNPDGEVSYATSKVELRLIDASTGNLLRTFFGRSPIFGTKETGEYNRSKAVLKAIEFSLDEILDSFLRHLDLLEWTTTIARIEGENIYINAGKLSGLRIGDTLEVYEPGREIIHPATQLSLGWTTGQLKGAVRITDLFGVDASAGKSVEGQGFNTNDVVKVPTP